MEPVLQVALDHMHLKRALLAAKEAVDGGADWLEAGTPLVKSEGIEVVRQLKKSFPGKTIVADLKTMDTGAFEVEIAAKAGADVITVMGVTDDATILEAVRAARRYGSKIMVDLMRVADKPTRAKELDPDRRVQEVHGCGRRQSVPQGLDPEPGRRDAEARRDDRPRPANQAWDETRRPRRNRQDRGRGLGEAGRGDRPREGGGRDRHRCRRRADRGLGRARIELLPRERRGRRRDRRRGAGPRHDPRVEFPVLQSARRTARRGTEGPRRDRERDRVRRSEGPFRRLDRRGRVRLDRRGGGGGRRGGGPRAPPALAGETESSGGEKPRDPQLPPRTPEVGTDSGRGVGRRRVQALLRDLKAGKVTVGQAMDALRDLPDQDLGFAKLDSHRDLRRGYPEVIFCLGKTPERILEIARRMDGSHGLVLATPAPRPRHQR